MRWFLPTRCTQKEYRQEKLFNVKLSVNVYGIDNICKSKNEKKKNTPPQEIIAENFSAMACKIWKDTLLYG